MNPLSIYLGAGALTLVYFGQVAWTIGEASRTSLADGRKLSDVAFGGKNWFNEHWLYLMVSVVVPFLIATIPELPELPESFYLKPAGVEMFAMSIVVEWIARFTINYLLVLITLECALVAAAKGLTAKWRTLVVVAIIIDFLHYLFLTYVRHEIQKQEVLLAGMSGLSAAFLVVGLFSAVIGSLAVVLPVSRLNEQG